MLRMRGQIHSYSPRISPEIALITFKNLWHSPFMICKSTASIYEIRSKIFKYNEHWRSRVFPLAISDELIVPRRVLPWICSDCCIGWYKPFLLHYYVDQRIVFWRRTNLRFVAVANYFKSFIWFDVKHICVTVSHTAWFGCIPESLLQIFPDWFAIYFFILNLPTYTAALHHYKLIADQFDLESACFT